MTPTDSFRRPPRSLSTGGRAGSCRSGQPPAIHECRTGPPRSTVVTTFECESVPSTVRQRPELSVTGWSERSASGGSIPDPRGHQIACGTGPNWRLFPGCHSGCLPERKQWRWDRGRDDRPSPRGPTIALDDPTYHGVSSNVLSLSMWIHPPAGRTLPRKELLEEVRIAGPTTRTMMAPCITEPRTGCDRNAHRLSTRRRRSGSPRAVQKM